MKLPNYFLADLPREAPLTPKLVTEACQTLRRNRTEFLESCSTDEVLRVFDDLGRSWLNPDYSFRRMALALPPDKTGFPRATLESGLDAFFQQLTGQNLRGLIAQDLGHPRSLDEFVSLEVHGTSSRSSLAQGPELMAHIASGNIPVPILLQIVIGYLVRSAQFVKCASGTSGIPRLFAHSIYELAPKFGACLELAEWPGGQRELESALLSEANCLTATGSDETLDDLRHRLPSHVRFVGYGHRVSFGFIASDVLSGFGVPELAAHAASDVTAWNQLGCLSPHVFYVQHGGRITAERFAEMLAAELDRRELTDPRGPVPTAVSAAIANRRAIYEVRAAHSSETRYWCSPNSTAWTVIYEADPRFQISCLNRFVYVKGTAHLTDALQAADPIQRHISTVGIAAGPNQARYLARELARWGARRVCPIGQMQRPPLTWRHDGRPALSDLITWTDWETG